MLGELKGPRGELTPLVLLIKQRINGPLNFFSPLLSTHKLLFHAGVIRDISLCSGQWLAQKLSTGQRAESTCQRSTQTRWDSTITSLSICLWVQGLAQKTLGAEASEDQNETVSSRHNSTGAMMNSQYLHKIKMPTSSAEREVVPKLLALNEGSWSVGGLVGGNVCFL